MKAPRISDRTLHNRFLDLPSCATDGMAALDGGLGRVQPSEAFGLQCSETSV